MFKLNPPKSKPVPFSDEQIRIKAYEIWQARGGVGGTPEDDWKSAIAALKAERSPIRKLGRWTRAGVQGIWNWTGVKEKKGWDFLQLLVVPLTLAVVGFGFQEFAKQREQQIAEDKAKQETLTKYLDQMSDLLQKELLSKQQNSETFIIAQAKTVTALQSLDPKRQHLIIQFLEAANLNNLDGRKGILYKARMSKAYLAQSDLSGAEFHSAEFANANLSKADLSKANLNGANLSRANLSKANLNGANLSNTNLSSTNLSETNLRSAKLANANLSNADLRNADLRNSKLSLSNLRSARLNSANLNSANLNKANFSGTNLSNADLSFVDLRDANLSAAILNGTDLTYAILLSTDLRTTKLTTNQQLEPALLCKAALPKGITVNPNRDCDRLQKILMNRYPKRIKTLEDARSEINEAQQRNWK